MDRLCERPGCSERASVAYGMRAEDLVFWLDVLPEGGNSSGGVLCRRHADSMVVPRGWTLDDLRDPDLHLFRPPARQPVRRQASELGASKSLASDPAPEPARPDAVSSSRRRRAERRRARTQQQLELADATGSPSAHASSSSTITTPITPNTTSTAATTLATSTNGGGTASTDIDGVLADDATHDAGNRASVDSNRDANLDTNLAANLDAGDPPDDPLTPWVPEFDEADDLDGLLAARSPLLARAFRTADRGG